MRYKSLDGLRGIAALTVVISHYSNTTGLFGGVLGWGGGQLGVMLFFCLSGFLMGELYIPEAPGMKAIGDYFRRRIARVMPLYLVMLFISFAWGLRGSAWPFYPVDEGNLADHLLFKRGVDVLWTIPVEIQFYAVFPFLWVIGSRSKYLLLAIIFGEILAIVLLHFPMNPVLLRYLPFFLSGIVISQIRPTGKHSFANLLFTGFVGLYCISFPQIMKSLGFGLGNLIPADQITGPWFSPFYLLMIASLVLLSLTAPVAEKLLGNRPLRFAGAISYSIYLLHYPLLRVLAEIFPLKEYPLSMFPIFVAIVLVLATLSFWGFEQPMRIWISGGKLLPKLDRQAA